VNDSRRVGDGVRVVIERSSVVSETREARGSERRHEEKDREVIAR